MAPRWRAIKQEAVVVVQIDSILPYHSLHVVAFLFIIRNNPVMSLKYDFHGKVIAVTGGASGIGLALVKLLAGAGARVSIADINEKALNDVVADIEAEGGDALGFTVNVADVCQVNAWIDQTLQRYGHLDGAANVAAVIGTGINKNCVEELEDDDWALVISVNLTGVMHCMRAELRQLPHGGSIVNVTSVAGSMGIAKNSAYSAAKHGVVGLSSVGCKGSGRSEHLSQLCGSVSPHLR